MPIRFVLIFSAVGLLAGGMRPVSGQEVDGPLSEKLQATLWVQTSLEYQALCRQAYSLAETKLQAALANPNRGAAMEQRTAFSYKPPAVILDVDETVLDNSPFNARLARDGTSYTPKAWAKWCNEKNASCIPGAKQFIQAADQAGVAVFFVTNREHALKGVTRDNLIRVLGRDVPEDHLLMKRGQAGWTSAKTNRRSHVAQRYRIALLIGDDVNDFVSLGNISPEERRLLAQHFQASWGHHWILLPNPVYGNWEKALLEYEFNQAESEKRRLLLGGLRTE